MLKLEEKIRNKSAKIGIVGLGYVGLPLATCESDSQLLKTFRELGIKMVNDVTELGGILQ